MLIPTKKQTAELNSAMLELVDGAEIVLKAKDKIDGTVIQRQKAQAYLKT